MITIIDVDMHKDFVYCQFEDSTKINYSLLEQMFQGTDRVENILFAKEMEAEPEDCLAEMGFEILFGDKKREWSEY